MAFNTGIQDCDKAEEGVWCTICDEDGGPGEFLVARAGNNRYLLAHERNGKRRAENAVERQNISLKSIAEGILLDWRNVDIPYSIEAAVALMNRSPRLLEQVMVKANDYENFRREDIAAQSKKPQKPSSTG